MRVSLLRSFRLMSRFILALFLFVFFLTEKDLPQHKSDER